MSFYSSS